jgi:predicted HicB family RNase H-like nuclease
MVLIISPLIYLEFVSLNIQLHKNIYKQALKESLSINAFIGKTLKDAVNKESCY